MPILSVMCEYLFVRKLIWKLPLAKTGEVEMVMVTAYIHERVVVLENGSRNFLIVSRSCEGQLECAWPNRF